MNRKRIQSLDDHYRFRRSRRGVAPLEMVLVLPVLVALFALISQVATVCIQTADVRNSARNHLWKQAHAENLQSVLKEKTTPFLFSLRHWERPSIGVPPGLMLAGFTPGPDLAPFSPKTASFAFSDLLDVDIDAKGFLSGGSDTVKIKSDFFLGTYEIDVESPGFLLVGSWCSTESRADLNRTFQMLESDYFRSLKSLVGKDNLLKEIFNENLLKNLITRVIGEFLESPIGDCDFSITDVINDAKDTVQGIRDEAEEVFSQIQSEIAQAEEMLREIVSLKNTLQEKITRLTTEIKAVLKDGQFDRLDALLKSHAFKSNPGTVIKKIREVYLDVKTEVDTYKEKNNVKNDSELPVEMQKNWTAAQANFAPVAEFADCAEKLAEYHEAKQELLSLSTTAAKIQNGLCHFADRVSNILGQVQAAVGQVDEMVKKGKNMLEKTNDVFSRLKALITLAKKVIGKSTSDIAGKITKGLDKVLDAMNIVQTYIKKVSDFVDKVGNVINTAATTLERVKSYFDQGMKNLSNVVAGIDGLVRTIKNIADSGDLIQGVTSLVKDGQSVVGGIKGAFDNAQGIKTEITSFLSSLPLGATPKMEDAEILKPDVPASIPDTPHDYGNRVLPSTTKYSKNIAERLRGVIIVA